MVALLVLLTILGCLIADSIVLAIRDDKVLVSDTPLVFAQDGGKKIDNSDSDKK